MMWWSMHQGWMTWMRFPLIVSNPLDKTCQCKHVVVNLPFVAVNPLESTWQKGKTWPNPRVWRHFNGHGPCLIVETQDTPFPNHYIESYIIFDNLYDQIHVEWYLHLPRCDRLPSHSGSAGSFETAVKHGGHLVIFFSGCSWCLLAKIEQTMQTFSFYSNFNL